MHELFTFYASKQTKQHGAKPKKQAKKVSKKIQFCTIFLMVSDKNHTAEIM